MSGCRTSVGGRMHDTSQTMQHTCLKLIEDDVHYWSRSIFFFSGKLEYLVLTDIINSWTVEV